MRCSVFMSAAAPVGHPGSRSGLLPSPPSLKAKACCKGRVKSAAVRSRASGVLGRMRVVMENLRGYGRVERPAPSAGFAHFRSYLCDPGLRILRHTLVLPPLGGGAG